MWKYCIGEKFFKKDFRKNFRVALEGRETHFGTKKKIVVRGTCVVGWDYFLSELASGEGMKMQGVEIFE